MWMIGCETQETPLTAPDTDPGNPVGSWVLQSFERSDGSVVPVVLSRYQRPGQYTLDLGEDGRAHIRADCNVCNGDYDVTGSSLSFRAHGLHARRLRPPARSSGTTCKHSAPHRCSR